MISEERLKKFRKLKSINCSVSFGVKILSEGEEAVEGVKEGHAF